MVVLYYCAMLLLLLLHCVQGRDDSRMASTSCDPDTTDDKICTDIIITSGSGDTPVSSMVGGCGDEWRVACVVSGSIVVALLLVFVLAVVTTCVYRKWRTGRHQTEDYAVVENLEFDTFHSIPYRRDGLPECPIDLHNSIDGETGGRRSRKPRNTWPPAGKRTSRRVTPSTPTMTWYYSAGKALPSPPSSSCDEVHSGEEDGYHLLLDGEESSYSSANQERVPSRQRREGEREGRQGRGDHDVGRVVGEAVAVEQFDTAVSNKYKDGMLGFQREFVSLYSGSEKSVSVAQTRENRAKNCFSNFYPYDDHRVILQSTPADSGHSDYINASYVDGFSKPNKFIATQVPLPHTVVDFWQMVWQERVSCIVLLTLNKEDGRGKLGERYYPDGLGTWCLGPFLVTTAHKTVCAHHTIRNISVQVSGSAPLEVCQLQITHWSRQGMRHMASTLLPFHRRFTELASNNTQPTVVHCSTGAGLTGVFIAVDCVLNAAEEEGKVDVWGVVNSLRQHRPRMVPTQEQYILIHEVLLEWLRWGNTEIPISQLTSTPIDCRWHGGEGQGEGEGEGEGEQVVGITLQNLLEAVGPMTSTPTSVRGQRHCDHPLSITHTAPGTCIPSSSDPYHRPTAITGYWQGNVLLVTHNPTHTSATQFWRTVLDKKCTTIIAISQSNKESYQYWPDGTAGQYTVHMMERGEEGGDKDTPGIQSVKRALQVEHCMSGQTQVVSQFHVPDWTGDVPSLCAIVEEVLRVLNANTHSSVLVHCSDGVSVCGVVCAVVVSVEQGLTEGLVDIPLTVRRIRTQLPTAVSTTAQMKLVLETVTAVLNRKLR